MRTRNGVLESAELNAASQNLSDRILQQLKFTADGKLLSAENAGVFGEAGGHHLTFRAHFPTENPEALLAINSALNSITSASHLTEVTFGKAGERQLARLDSQKQYASFGPEPQDSEAPVAVKTRNDPTASAMWVILLLAAIPTLGGFIAFLKFARKHLRDDRTQLP